MANGKPRKKHYWRHDGICLFCGLSRESVTYDAVGTGLEEVEMVDAGQTTEELPGWHWKRAVNVLRRMIGMATWWRNIGWLNPEEGEE